MDTVRQLVNEINATRNSTSSLHNVSSNPCADQGMEKTSASSAATSPMSKALISRIVIRLHLPEDVLLFLSVHVPPVTNADNPADAPQH